MKKNAPYAYVKIESRFQVDVAEERPRKIFSMAPKGLYINYNSSRAWINYANGDSSDDALRCQAQFEIPTDPEFLKEFAKILKRISKELESE